jgi:hypothetical protein
VSCSRSEQDDRLSIDLFFPHLIERDSEKS